MANFTLCVLYHVLCSLHQTISLELNRACSSLPHSPVRILKLSYKPCTKWVEMHFSNLMFSSILLNRMSAGTSSWWNSLMHFELNFSHCRWSSLSFPTSDFFPSLLQSLLTLLASGLWTPKESICLCGWKSLIITAAGSEAHQQLGL